MAVSKVCTKCRKKLPLSKFYKNKKGKDGLFTQCKSCMNKANLEHSKIYKSKNPWKARLVLYNCRHGSKLREKDLIKLFNKQNKCCAACGKQLNDSWGLKEVNLDHIIPQCIGGKTNLNNIQILCEMCNIGKYKWTMLEYIAHCERVTTFNRKEQ